MAEQRLIDAAALLKNSDVFTFHSREYGSIEVIAVDAIGDAPTVDAVPVVRCKDCKHFDGNNACYSHAADENGTPIFVREHDFCSYGERRDAPVVDCKCCIGNIHDNPELLEGGNHGTAQT